MTGRTFERKVYLDLKTLAEAKKIFADAFFGRPYRKTETIATAQALGRITAVATAARLSSPGFHNAAMDGIAVQAETTYGASQDRPKALTIGQDAFYVNTGHALPEGTDAVIMIEQVQDLEGDKVIIEAAAYPWQHVRKVGEDIVATEMVCPGGTVLGPYEMGALVAAGVVNIEVKQPPAVAIIPTGSELVSYMDIGNGPPPAGKIVEFNSVILSALTQQAGGTPMVSGIVPDDYETILATLKQAAESEADLIIINAGSSAGSEDYTATAIDELGHVLVHGVTIMPGKPTILGSIMDKPVIGNPGYPVSAVISFEQFAAPYIAKMLGSEPKPRTMVEVKPSQALPSKLGLEEFLRVKLGQVDETIVAAPLPRGAGSITTLTRADGIIRIPTDVEGIGSDETVQAELIKSSDAVQGAIIAIGSHDNTLDVLNDLLRRRNPLLSLSSSNVGSLGGLLTLKRGFSHVAGTHLLDTETGDYNYSYIRKHLGGIPLRLVNLVHRQQGFVVLPGNPKNIKGFADLTREGVRYINRQAGSGTRILLDHNLKEQGLNPDNIEGYDSDEFTHMAVAVAVLSGRADAGLAIYSAAKALNLDFVPVTTERYDLVILEKYWKQDKIQALLNVIRSLDFREAVLELGGYGVDQTGDILWTWDGHEQ
jgi:putative molybdopterin biosynthesis protein